MTMTAMLFTGCGEKEADSDDVKASVEAAKAREPQKVVDSFVLGNPHDSIFPAIYGATPPENVEALGVLETFSAATAIQLRGHRQVCSG